MKAEKGTKTEQVAAANQESNEEDDSMAAEQDDTTPEGTSWTKTFLKYLIHGIFPQDISEARRVSRRSNTFTIINKQLYKRSISQVLQKCIDEEEVKALLLEIHKGS